MIPTLGQEGENPVATLPRKASETYGQAKTAVFWLAMGYGLCMFLNRKKKVAA